nr:MAG TPA: hypothetical protein [Caudoviricetes sp.]DAJ53683.1 MAG TPA: hypothetical protein [Caudoviricetes sp.]DAZ42892.1 MAG TPA: hypothetical protein [Caudoviricetes sp.]
MGLVHSRPSSLGLSHSLGTHSVSQGGRDTLEPVISKGGEPCRLAISSLTRVSRLDIPTCPLIRCAWHGRTSCGLWRVRIPTRCVMWRLDTTSTGVCWKWWRY